MSLYARCKKIALYITNPNCGIRSVSNLVVDREHYGRSRIQRSVAQNAKRRQNKEKHLKTVLNSIDMNQDPYEAIRCDPSNFEVKRLERYKMSDDSKAAAILNQVYSSKEFSMEVQKRSSRSGEILDLALEGLNNMVTTFIEERAKNPDIKPKDAKITPQLFHRVTETIMKFYLNTQKQVITQISAQKGGEMKDVIAKLSDDELRVLTHEE